MPRLSKIGAAALAAFGWTSGAAAVTANYLQVAGGGGGGGTDFGSLPPGGGGAGGYLTGTTTLNPTLSYTVIVGAGGAGGYSASTGSIGVAGSNSQFGTLTASVGGGYGAWGNSIAGGSGGSGGGGSYGGVGGTATSGQGSAGGTASTSLDCRGGAGGGGAGAVGGNGSASGGGAGGNGLASSITGTSTYYAGGGGGSGLYRGGGFTVPSGATGGLGGGGAGGNGTTGGAASGTANTGGGGGTSVVLNTPNFAGGNGGSGVVIISYPSPQKFGGGIVTSSGANTIHTFQTSGTLSPLSTLSASYLIVAGGAGGGSSLWASTTNGAGGGGAGGLLSGSSLTIDTSSIYVVTVGAGGSGSTAVNVNGSNGTSSILSIVSTTAVGGGGGGSQINSGGVMGSGQAGGSGGGGCGAQVGNTAGGAGAGTSGQGNNGGAGLSQDPNRPAGGGGGSGGAGVAGSGSNGGNGGVATISSISGTSTYYAGGGGGGVVGGTAGLGGGTATTANKGGAGDGAVATASGGSATANTGGGGGGAAGAGSGNGGNGGSGVVIISYAGSTQLMAGGTVTISGNNVIHTFTSSGYLTPLKLVNNSLRFRSSASAYLSRTFGTPTNANLWTFSVWLKKSNIGAFGTIIGNLNTLYPIYQFVTSDKFGVYDSGSGVTTAVYRDPAAWYHLVIQRTSSTAVSIYFNGVLANSFTSQTNAFNTAGSTYTIGRSQAGEYFDGYMTEVNFVDGQALTPNSFGTFNSYGVWQPITYGGSYGTNGFYLPFTANTESFAGSFNGSTQYLATTNTQIIPATGDFTVEAMIYKTNTDATIFSQGTAGNAGRLEVLVIGTSLTVQIGASALTFPAGIANNRWYYIAFTRTGSTVTLYANGIFVGSGTLSAAVQTTPFWIGLDWTSTYFGGFISNLRVSNVVRTISPATAPTTNFANDANTVLLTLQGATIVDNSTNAYAITNNGTVTTGKTYPFAYRVFNDQSPQGNNWTPNNISGITGSTLDSMTDVPTLTSATAANYATWNPLVWRTVTVPATFTNGNLRATGASVYTWATQALPTTGKFYCELTATAGSSVAGVGLCTLTLQNGVYTNETQYLTNGNKSINGTDTAYGSSYTTGDVIGIAADVDAGTVTFYKNNVSQGAISGSYAGTFFFALYGGSWAFSINCGQQPWAYTPPTNFVALNTFNL
jgi:hypothetical protein